ncbi:pre-mRNA splicing factor SLT11 (RNA recognition domain-containing protein) [Colletotrichum truncatum]|uniref:Pre-mRNA splicing factor SLT11 (RNA recognition domain-containing protein) n=1 Tax=Colletotrichum truncatum TaxID=5467 RepID=A0ACC3Z1G1_COLTU|nr:pre-mRNA splicing factor SLT11 (RNA recognition domain-containing protein) [Colletotrichum truncatum]KAF6800387.1 pre-mRNA splicing factor SLT11 (RNA recognition domain-containing protein) [Colletotrichum truncatum]
MPPQIKQDLNRSGWESTDFPSVCENCLPENPYVKMLKEDYGSECKLCTRPFTVFSWSADRAHGRKKRTNICLTCARLKNCCQACMLDLSFGLPIVVRDAALKMVAPGPSSDINREYFAQNNERAIEEGRAGVEEYEKTDDKARELLRRLAASKPYFRKGRPVEGLDDELQVGLQSGSASASSSRQVGLGGNPAVGAGVGGPGPIRTRDSRAAAAFSTRSGRAKQVFPSTAQLPPGPQDWMPPADKNIMSLFVTGVEDDLPEHKIRDFFKVHGKIKSLVCSHMSHCAFVNYETREGAEKAAAACQGRAVIAGCPLRVRWGVPKAIGTMDKEQRSQMLIDARRGQGGLRSSEGKGGRKQIANGASTADASASATTPAVAPPPGSGDGPQYASLKGD